MTGPDTSGLASVLTGIHASIAGYTEAGAVLLRLQAPVQLLTLARGADDALRDSRDRFNDAIAAGAASPPQALPGYALPFPITDLSSVVRLLIGMEDRLSALAAAGAASSAGRLLIVDVLGASAVRAVRLRLLAGSPPAKAVSPLPGMPARS